MSNILYRMINERADKGWTLTAANYKDWEDHWVKCATDLRREFLDSGLKDTAAALDLIVRLIKGEHVPRPCVWSADRPLRMIKVTVQTYKVVRFNTRHVPYKETRRARARKVEAHENRSIKHKFLKELTR